MLLLTTLRARLLLLFSAILLGTLYYSVSGLWTDWRRLAQARQIEAIQQSAVAVSNLVHELQKERGLSAGFIGSRGERFAAELSSQRELSNRQREALHGMLAKLGEDALPASLRKALDAGIAGLAELAPMREKISALSVTGPESFGFYTNVIDRLTVMVDLAPT
ncbi:MAG: nitrate- and nitrite sensing domain-containing protein, partial [Rhodocyclaceae bacterium]